MATQKVMLTSGGRSSVVFLESLEELADCTLRDVEFSKPAKSGSRFQLDYHQPWIFLIRDNDLYRMNDLAYTALKNAYKSSGKSIVTVDALIGAVDEALRQGE